MKTLLIIRHAKSDQTFFGKDFERPLNEQGKKDAPAMAKNVLQKNIIIDAFVSSPALRAKTTAEIFCKAFNKKKEEIIFFNSLYHAPAAVFYDVIFSLNDKFNTVAIFAHNPGISFFINDLQYDVKINKMPTCGVFAVQANVHSWIDFAKAKIDFLFFNYP